MAELDEKLLKTLDDRLKNMLTTMTSLDSVIQTVVTNSKSSLSDLISLFQASGASLTDMLQAFKGNRLADLLGIKDAAGQVKQLNEQIETLNRNTKMGGKASWVEDEDTGRGSWKVLKGDEFKNEKEERDAINALAEARQKLRDLTLSDSQLWEKIVALINKAATETQREEEARARGLQKASEQQAVLAKSYKEIDEARSIVSGGKKYGELMKIGGEQFKKYEEFSRILTSIREQQDAIEKEWAGSKDRGAEIYKQEQAIANAKKEASEAQKQAKQEEARQEKELNKAIKDEEKTKKKDEEDYLGLLKRRNELLEKTYTLTQNLRNAKLAEKSTDAFQTRSQSQISSNAETIKKLNEDIKLYEDVGIKLTAEGQQKKEEMEIAHQNKMTNIRLQGEQARQRIEERKTNKTKAESKRDAKEEEKTQRQADAIVKRKIDLENKIRRIDNDRAIRQQTNSNISKQALKAEGDEYTALKDRVKQLTDALAKLEGKQAGVTAKAEQNNAPYKAYVDATEEKRKAKAIEDSTKKLKEQKRTLDSMLPSVQRLASAFGVAFSVRGLAQFGKKLIETRGEFEMQFVAMKQIIGDVDAATRIWNQTMQQALQSPFKAMQLVTYTKQLAAYRIETEKLFDTTKRLADISAGLGVDMGRLILAYGQVKSANFLRASEVRQFTEAGVNIVGNLAQYFTELEGRAVSTADVMERITKRMVIFSDVEEIFRRMTDEGGEFYKMQEIQADTVKGQINKLHDAYDQMLNTIGQANQGTLRDMIDQLNKMVRNWREVALFLKENGIALAAILPLYKSYKKGVELAAAETTYFTTTTTGASVGLRKLAVSERLATIATNTFRGAMFFAKTALKTFVPLLVIEGIVLLINKMTEAGREAKRLSQSLDEVGSKNAQSLQSNIDGFNELVEKLKQATEGSQEYYDIRNKIQSKYGEFLDSINAETISVENLANAYDRVIERMREKSRQHIMEEGLEEISKDYGKYFEEFVSDISKFEFSTGLRISRDEAQNIAKIARDLYEKNEKYRGLENTTPLFQAAFEQYGYDTKGLNFVQLQWKDFYKAIERSYEKQIELETKANSLTKATSDTHQEYLDQLALEEEHEKNIAKLRDDASIKSSGRLQLAIQAEQLRYEEKKLELQAQYQKKSDEWLKNEKDKLKENYGAFLNAYNEQVKAYIGGRFGEGWMQGDNSDAWKAYNFMIANQDRLSQGQTKWEEKILNDKKLTEENIKRIKEQQATQTAADSEAAKALNESLKQEKDRLELIKKQMELLGLHEKKKGGSGSANNSIYGERIRLLQDMLQKYKQLAKEAYGYAKAEGKVSESFEDAWNSIMPAGYGDLEVPTSYKALAEMLQRLEAFTPAFDKNGQLSKMLADLKKAVSDALSQVDIELSVRIRDDFGKQMEEAFGNYELTLELDKLNLPKGLAADMWGIEETDLQDLRKRLSQMYMGLRDENGQLSDEAFKDYEKFLNKIDDLERKQQKERLKDYSKYLEAQYSERVKIEMDYVRKLAALEAETAIKEPQKSEIREGLKREFLEKSRKQDWEDFKGSEFYVGMMEDLEKQGSASLEVMRKKLLEMRENAENLSPRALKEVVNALEKIDELEKKRIPPLRRIREEQEKLSGIEIKDVYERIAANQEKLAQDEQEQKDLERMIMLEEERQKLEKQGITLEEAKARLARSEQALSLILPSLDTRSDGTKEGEERRRILTETVNQAKKEVETWAEIVRILSGQATIDKQEGGSKYRGLSLSDLKKRRDDAKQRIKDLEGVIGKDEELVKAQKDLEDAWNDTWEAAKRWAQSINGIFDGVMDTIGYFSDSTSTLTAEWKEFGDTSIAALTDLVSGIQAYQQANAAAQKAGLATVLFTANGLQLAMVVLGVIIKVVQAIAKLHDARIDKEIEQSKERVDDLQKAYERLEKQIEKTFDTVSYMREFNKETQNLYEQIEEANRQIAAAQDYKSEDKRKEAIDAAEDAKQQALDALEEIKQAQIEVFGGIGENNYRSAAEGFVDAWKSAFLETGDGLQGVQDHFDEFLNDWFVKQATMRVTQRTLEPLFRQIDSAVDQYGSGGANVLMSELSKIRERFGIVAPQLSEALKELAGMWGLQGEGGLSGLAAGIQGMPEEQANILEAYWNSVRGDTASIDMNVATIVGLLSNGTSGGGGGGKGNIFGDPNVETNPMLQQLSLIAANTQATHQLLQSVTKSGHSLGGAGIKVFVD